MVKLTKNELKKQKDALKRFQRYLPTLQLKKQQLQMVIRQVEQEHQNLVHEKERLRRDLMQWIGVFNDGIDLTPYVEIERLRTSTGKTARGSTSARATASSPSARRPPRSSTRCTSSR